MNDPEVPLSGGTLNAVVKVGDTVRRPAGPWTPTVHALLRHIRAEGFDLAPEPLGLDQAGREILGYIDGDTVGWALPWPAWIRSADMLEQVGKATALYHRAVAGFRPGGVVPWQSGSAPLGESQIVCHNDLAPYNVVVAGGRLQGVIDWDLAGPGSPQSDLAFVAWQWVPLHGPLVTRAMGWSEAERSSRLQILLDAYGLADRDRFIEAVVARVVLNRKVMLDRAQAGDPGYRALVEQGHVAGMDEALSYLEGEGAVLQAGLERLSPSTSPPATE